MKAATQIKSLDEQGRFSGYASVFGIIDSQNDMILAGAFQRSVDEHGPEIKLLWQHDTGEPIGVIETLREDAYGLYVEGRLLLDVQRAKEAHALLKAGAVEGLSIGYRPKKWRIQADSGARLLEEVALYEISLVTFPANSKATARALGKNRFETNELAGLSHALSRAINTLQNHY